MLDPSNALPEPELVEGGGGECGGGVGLVGGFALPALLDRGGKESSCCKFLRPSLCDKSVHLTFSEGC